jgi:hypothetical protein
MGYRYIALVDTDATREAASSWRALEAVLDRLGLQHRMTYGPIRLYAAEDTPR